MAGRIVVNKNILHSTDANLIGRLFNGEYQKQEIVIDNTKGSEGIWIVNENGILKKIEAKPALDITVYSGLTEDEVRNIIRDLAETDLDLNYAKQTRVNELESQIIPEERIVEIAQEAADNAVQDIPRISDENIANVMSVIQLIGENPEIMEKIQLAIDNHVALSESQYAELIETGHTVLDNGRTITYSDKVYYNIYEDGQSPYDDEGEGTIIDIVDEDGVAILEVTFGTDEEEDDVLLISGNAEIDENDEEVLII